MALRSILAACLLCLTVVAAQSIIRPSNFTTDLIFTNWNSTSLFLRFQQNKNSSPAIFPVDPAQNAGVVDLSGMTGLSIGGNIVLVNSSNAIKNLAMGDIAYMSCEPASYGDSNLGLDQILSMTSTNISGGMDDGTRAGAVILYSTISTFCDFDATSGFSYRNVFILPTVAQASSLEGILKAPNATALSGLLLHNDTTSSNSTGPFSSSDDLGPTPTTTVAMIILYSVTGIITLCFIVVIVTGAVRAHRHPDRYGLLNLPGGAHQRRARALARAMLDTIPIVKFGEREPAKKPDVEQATELENRREQTSPDAMPAAPGPNSEEAQISEEGAQEHNTPAEESAQQAKAATTEDAAEAGLACSVCTEDFVKGQDTRVLPCNHKFHPECIDPWLLNVSGTCPLCRVDLHPPENAEQPPDQGDSPATEDSPPTLGPGGVPVYRPLRLTTLLTPRRMRHATPEQRVRALRDFRDARRASDSGGVTARTRHAPSIRGTRLTRLFRRDTTSMVQAEDVPAVPQLPPLQLSSQPEQSSHPPHTDGADQAEASGSRS